MRFLKISGLSLLEVIRARHTLLQYNNIGEMKLSKREHSALGKVTTTTTIFLLTLALQLMFTKFKTEKLRVLGLQM